MIIVLRALIAGVAIKDIYIYIYNKTRLFKAGKGLPKDVFKHVKPIFVELCNETLLKRCIDCKTQNQNEAFNGTV